MLVLVDGKRDVARLAGLRDAVRADHHRLEELLNTGFIEVIGESDDERALSIKVMADANRSGKRPFVQVPTSWNSNKATS